MNIIVWGLGISGISALKYLSHSKTDSIYVVNQGEVNSWPQLEDVLTHVSKDNCFCQSKIDKNIKIDQIILSPGVPRYLKELKPFVNAGVEIISDIELAYRGMKDIPIIAITGTNGKTTTTTMISRALELAGKKVFTGGNIGIAACDFFNESDYDLVVLELSSFQLESLQSFHANISIILNITENHMERYSHFDDYKNAKLEIIMNQTEGDWFITQQEFLKTKTLATKVEIVPITGYSFEKSKILGEHNYENFFCVESVLKALSIENHRVIIQELIDSFNGVEFRLQYINSINSLNFYNDAKSTNTASTMAAVKSFENKPLYLIVGGKLRDLNVGMGPEFVGMNIQTIFAFGEAAPLLKKELDGAYNIKIFRSLDEIITKENLGELRGNVLFSPGFPSFDQYSNYIERGSDFNKLVNAL
jgi:UDP-N-acetylmuramoylalanine--D-glutamate ligase